MKQMKSLMPIHVSNIVCLHLKFQVAYAHYDDSNSYLEQYVLNERSPWRAECMFTCSFLCSNYDALFY